MSRCYNSHYYLVVSSTLFATEVSANLLLSDAATCVDYDDESVCIHIIMNGNGKGIH